ncbi:MAG: hypothetical protein ABIL16_00470 [candidate division WOR-3 bacterium]
MKHEEVKDKIPLLVIGKLTGWERFEVENHIKACDGCKRLYEFELYLQGSLRKSVIFGIKRAIVRWMSYALGIVLFLTLMVQFHRGVDIYGLDDLTEGYILINGEGFVKATLFVDGKKFLEKRGKGVVYFDLNGLPEGIYYINVKVLNNNRVYVFERVVEKVDYTIMVSL